MILSSKDMNAHAYEIQLNEKQLRIQQQFADLYDGEIDIFRSELQHYRMRAEFRVWHEGDDLYHIMFDPKSKERIRIDEFPVASKTINLAMQTLLSAIKDWPILRHKLFQVDYLSGLSDELVISMLYHKPLDDTWLEAAQQLKEQLSQFLTVDIVGRARKQKQQIDRNYIFESLPINGKHYRFKHVENSFTQPNAKVNCQMIEWALAATESLDGDLLELYCGAGNFSLPLAQNFRRVVGTEISRTSVEAAQVSLIENKIDNVSIVRMSSEEFTDAYQNKKPSQRLHTAGLDDLEIATVLVDPPRAGVDADTIAMMQHYQNIIYISCNPDTLHRDIKMLRDSHELCSLALFDQFPYTHHIECGAVLRKFS
ncbi:MAG: tRNA (uridine(54)-C5)-methyltransferase TrmA [Aestuariibacter sp.]